MPRFTVLATLFLLTGCAGMLPDLVGDPPALFELRAPAQVSVEAASSDKQLLVDVPVASAGIDTPRMALVQQDGTLAYYKNVSWTDRAPIMMQTVLVTAFDRSGKLPAVGRENVGLRADYLLKTDIVDFQADYGAGAPPMVKVTLNAKLIGMPRRIILAGREFNGQFQAEKDDVVAVQKAFQQASDQAMTDLVAWTLQELRSDARRR
jgi:cholesterol transport system auxiliary component